MVRHWPEWAITGGFITGGGCFFFSNEMIGAAMLIVSALGLIFQVFKYWRSERCKK